MQAIPKICAALIAAAGVFIATEAAAERRPAYCPSDHDHRAHDANYYDYYEADRYSRRGNYRRNHRYDHYNRYDRHRSRRGYRHPRSEVVFRRHINARRYDAYITVVEENYWTYSGRVQRVCSVLVRGPEAYYVPHRRLERAARRNCSRYARIQYL